MRPIMNILKRVSVFKNNFLTFFIKKQNHFSLTRFKVDYGKDTKFNGIIFISSLGSLKIGNSCIVNSGKNQNPIGGDIVTRLIVEKSGILKIGNNVGISNSTIYCTKQITIKDNVFIGGGTKIWDTDFHSIDPNIRIHGGDNQIISKSITIEESVLIGGSVIILKGVTIGKNSVVGAGSVVAKNIPENEIWAGNPAKYIKTITKN